MLNCYEIETRRRGKYLATSMVLVAAALAPALGIAIPAGAAQEGSMMTGQGKTMTLRLNPLPNSRGYRYCELLFNYGNKGLDIYTTSPFGECSLEWWDSLDLQALAKEYGAQSVIKNGPQRWSMDEVALMISEPRSIAGAKMGFGAHLPAGTMETVEYQVFNPAKTQNLVWKAGEPVYQLVDPDGHVYVLQGYKVETRALTVLGDQLQKLPEGWRYRAEVLAEDLVMNLTPSAPIPSVSDEFHQYYIRIPE